MGCQSSNKTASAGAVVQGISGQIRSLSGNHMPSPDAPASAGTPVRSTVCIHELTGPGQAEQIGSSAFYRAIHSRLVQTVSSDSLGYYEAALPEGEYSVFVKMGDRYYANLFDSQNHIAPARVEKGKLTELNITISANASF